MIRYLVTTLFLLAPALAPAAEPTARTWDVDGAKREGLVCAPAKKTEGKVPLVFDFHGHGGTAKNSARQHHLHETWPEAVVVYFPTRRHSVVATTTAA